MLIVAVPKSASTSLMETLGHRLDLSRLQKIPEGLEIPTSFPVLGSIHKDVREYTENHRDEFLRKDRIYKQHIPPSEHNLQLLQDVPKIVLVRPAAEIIEAYFRAEKRGLHRKKPAFKDCETAEDWLTRAKEMGLYEELERFWNLWEVAIKSEPGSIFLSYAELLNAPDEKIRKIEQLFGYEGPKGPVILSKRRYSRESRGRLVARRWLERTRQQIVYCTQRVGIYEPLRRIKKRIF